jgi:hypothetical protein
MAEDFEKEIANVFKKLVKKKYNASFVYSFIYTDKKELGKSEPKGRINFHGSKEEIEIHIDTIKEAVAKKAADKKKQYADSRNKDRQDRPQKGN